MKDFHEWLADLTTDLRKVAQEPAVQSTPIDYNAIHDILISAIKSVAWRAQSKQPMEDRIHLKIDKVVAQYDDLRSAMQNEVNTGLRSQDHLDRFERELAQWISRLQDVRQKCKSGDIPEWQYFFLYHPWQIPSI